MTSRRKFAVLFSLAFAACLIGLLLLLSRQGVFTPPKPSIAMLSPGGSEAARQHALALKDLQETRAEIAKMKAHGIGMPASSAPSGLVKDGTQQ